MLYYFNTYSIIPEQKYKDKDSIQDELQFLISKGTEGLKNNRLIDKTDRETRLVHLSSTYDLKVHLKLKKNYFDYILKNNVEKKLEYQNSKIEAFFNLYPEYEKMYTTWLEPKNTKDENGKMQFRRIWAPFEELKSEQRAQKEFMETTLGLLTHNAAHAYIKGRSTYTNADTHKDSNNFMKIDLKDFFPSLTTELLEEVLPKIGIFTFAQGQESTGTRYDTLVKGMKRYINNIIKLATRENALPQGTPLSPLLSNLCMIPLDYYITESLKSYRKKVIYTRYSDDMTFSSYKKIIKDDIINIVNEHLRYYNSDTLIINEKKTRLSTKFGKNRVTGLKINANNDITIGYKEKRKLKHELQNILIAKATKQQLPYYTSETLGWLSYLNGIEKGYYNYITEKLKEKFNIPKDITSLISYVYSSESYT